VKVLHICTSDIQGGAARAAFRLHKTLSTLGEQSSMFVAQKDSTDPTVHRYFPTPSLVPRVKRVVRKEWIRKEHRPYNSCKPGGYEHFRDDRTEFGSEVLRPLPESDIINLHWIAGFIDYQHFFPRIPIRRPTVWTLHDMNPFTGGCHFDDRCGRFTERCGACPQLGSTEPEDLSREIWERKKSALEKTPPERLCIVAPSQWLAGEAQRSSLMSRFHVEVIPNGVDTDVFRPLPVRDQMRRALEIPLEARVVLFLAEYATNRRKGFALFDRALSEISHTPNLFLVSLGKGSPVTKSRIPHLHLGSISNDSLLASIYNVADVFVIPSIQDNLPNTVLEAMACGIPIAGFNAGGISDMVRDGETGRLARVGDINGLAKALKSMIGNQEDRRRMGVGARQLVEENFSLQLQAARYAELYRKILHSADAESRAAVAVG